MFFDVKVSHIKSGGGRYDVSWVQNVLFFISEDWARQCFDFQVLRWVWVFLQVFNLVVIVVTLGRFWCDVWSEDFGDSFIIYCWIGFTNVSDSFLIIGVYFDVICHPYHWFLLSWYRHGAHAIMSLRSMKSLARTPPGLTKGFNGGIVDGARV